MYNLFTRFPVISYNGSLARNIFAKIKFTNTLKNLNVVFYPYVVQEGERADVIAANYYDDARYSWLIYFANDIVDPYYEWPMTANELDRFIITKYGSIQNANREIAYWTVNWEGNDTIITTSAYDALPAARKKYFKPIVGINNQVVNYEPNNLDLLLETNKTVNLAVANSASFNIGEYIIQKTSGTTTGSGFIRGISDNNIVVQNILGTFANTSGSVGNIINDDNSTTAVSNATTLNQSIPTDEEVYWKYVTKFDYEFQLNEEKRSIRLIDKGFVDQIEKEMSELL